MKRLTFIDLLAALTFIGLAKTTCALELSPDPLRIMLQGESAADLQLLVENNGGTVTHSLHIINAVGAVVTRPQLDTILKSPLVTRYLDDLSTTGAPKESPEEEAENCDIGGALDLELGESRFSWALFNTGDEASHLQSLQISWPARLGDIRSLSLGNIPIQSVALQSGQQGNISVQLAEHSILHAGDTASLNATFSTARNTWEDEALSQRDFKITATFDHDCSTELIPGYPNNHEDSYFPTVIGADALHRNGITGRGITVAIVDSGLWETDVLALDTRGRSRILARYDAITDVVGTEVFDETGHGTHMTSVIAHSGEVTQNGKPTGSFKGVAPDVNLVAVKAFNVEGQGDLLDIVRALQFVVDNRKALDIKVLNLSFSARPRWDYWLDPINQAVMKAWASGIVVVAAAGNEGPEPMTIGSPGNLPYVITVGAVTDSWTLDTRDDDYIPDFSSRGPTPNADIKPDIVAPGGHMTGIMRPGSALTLEHPNYFLTTGEFVMTGTSQASALISGMVALLLQLEPDLSPDDIKCKLTSSAELAINRDGSLAYSPFQQGNGYANVSRAVTLGQRGCGNADLDIEKDIAGLDHYQGPAIILEDGSTSLPGLEEIYSGKPSEKGLSSSRKWGVKDHIERANPEPIDPNSAPATVIDWESAYREEKSRMEALAAKPLP